MMELNGGKLSLISQGAGSAICLYGEKDGGLILKIVESGRKQAKHLLNQYTILKQINHQLIIAPYKFKSNVDTSKLQLIGSKIKLPSLSDIFVMEYAQKSSLITIMKERTFSVPQIRYFIQEISQALQFLHSKYIVHRDLKLDNVLVSLNDGYLICKLADFGFASSCRSEEGLVLFNSYKGTKRGYMAPEIHNALINSDQFYDARKSDIFALGIIIFALLVGRLPFEYANPENKLYKLIIEDKIDEFWAQHASALKRFQAKQSSMVEEFQELFISMVKWNPKQRVNIQDVLDSCWLNGRKEKTLG